MDEKLRSLGGTLPSCTKKNKNPLSLFEKIGLSNNNLLLTSKLFYVVLFHGRKVSNDDGLSIVSAVRTLRPLILIKFHEVVPEASVGRGVVLCG